MDRSSLIVVVMPVMIPIALLTGIALPFIAAGRPGRARRTLARADDAAPAGYLYVPCVRDHGYPAGTRRWVQEVPIVKKTARLIYYAGVSWDRREAVVSPGCISRERFETDTLGHDGCPAGVIPIPGDRYRPGQAGRLFFATREAAEDHLHHGERERAGRAAPQALLIRGLRRAMANAHPDRGGTAEQFIQARRRYHTALRSA